MNTTDICDDLGERALSLAPCYQHFGGRHQFAGEAVTIQCFEDSSRVKELIQMPGKGKVLVVDAGGSTRCAVWGDQSGQIALANGWEGIVIRGAVRDVARNASLALGLIALAAVPRKSNRQGLGEHGLTIDMGGILCHPGDQVICDEDGVLIIRARDWQQYLTR